MAGFNILSLDGGGIRGVLTAALLERVEAAIPGFLAGARLLAGTSTGGIIAAALAAGRTPSNVRILYEKNGRTIFDDPALRIDLGGLVAAHYPNDGLLSVLRAEFGGLTLGELGRRVLIPAFDLRGEAQGRPDDWGPKFFHNFPGPDSDREEPVVDVLMRTSAAPTYFPSWGHYVDGGVAANNPSMAAVAQALDARNGLERAMLDDVAVLSIGTGSFPRSIPGSDHDWGDIEWMRNGLIDMILDGNVGIPDFQCAQVLGDRYFRASPSFPPGFSAALDDVCLVPRLVEVARGFDLGPLLDWARANWMPGAEDTASG